MLKNEIQIEKQKQKGSIGKERESISELWDNFRQFTIYVTGVSLYRQTKNDSIFLIWNKAIQNTVGAVSIKIVEKATMVEFYTQIIFSEMKEK